MRPNPIRLFFIALFCFVCACSASSAIRARDKEGIRFYKPTDHRIQYTGRIDFSNPLLPRFWAPGVYIKIAFEGSSFELIVNDENRWGGNNYLSVLIDDLPVKRLKLSGKQNVISLGDGLVGKKHLITICKSTESGIGYLELVGFRCRKLIQAPPPPDFKMEFIGNSITCGTGSDVSGLACGSGEWYDQHNAFLSYGPLTARALNARWQLTSVSGIGLTRSCCGGTLIMPDVYDKINLGENAILWDFKKFQPDVVTICLGQNDGMVGADKFCSAYIIFINRLRQQYPKASLICLTSPMADDELSTAQQLYLDRIVRELNAAGDQKVHRYAFRKRYHKGCGGHPSLQEHQAIATELSGYIKSIIAQ